MNRLHIQIKIYLLEDSDFPSYKSQLDHIEKNIMRPDEKVIVKTPQGVVKPGVSQIYLLLIDISN